MKDDIFRSTRMERAIDAITIVILHAIALVCAAVILAAGYRLVLWVIP